MANVEALLKVVEILEATPDEAVDLNDWVNDCGTAACAIGHAASHPWFQERGFKIKEGFYKHPLLKEQDEEGVEVEKTGWSAIQKFFNISADVSEQLFALWRYIEVPDSNNDKEMLKQQQLKIGIRKKVINRIKEFVGGL